MKQPRAAFTLAEVLIALAVIGIGFAALALTQVTNLRASAISRTASETKSAANQVLEDVMSIVLETDDSSGTLTYAFNDFYWSCPTSAPPSSGALAVVDDTRACTDDRIIDENLPSQVDVAYAIVGESGIPGEGVLTVTVTATHAASGQMLTIGDRVTCYDIYPSPTSTAPEPCPPPLSGGGGRP